MYDFISSDNTYKDCYVRREKVLNAITWLISNNPFYSDVKIDHVSLQGLPENGIPDELLSIDDPDVMDVPFPKENDTADKQPEHNHVNANEFADQVSSFIPFPLRKMQEEDAIRSAINQKDPLEWPLITGQPINEFQTNGLASMAFPTLFPYGRADPTNKARERSISLTEGFKHLMKYADQTPDLKYDWRFASHPRFSYWALNMKQRHQILSQANIYMQQNPGDANLTVEELKEMVGNLDGKELMNRLQRYASKVQGSRQYWYQRYQELLALMEQKGAPTFFWTVSAADNYWPDLQRLLQQDPNVRHAVRVQAVISNPHVTDWFFTSKLQKFVEHWLYNSLDAEWHWYRYEWQARGSIHAHGCAKLRNDPGLCELVKRAAEGWSAEQKKEKKPELAEELQPIIDAGLEAKAKAIQYCDWLVTTINEALPQEENQYQAPNPHPCCIPFQNVVSSEEDYHDLVNSVERHTRCSPAYCLKVNADGEEICRFGYPIPLAHHTDISFEEKGDNVKATLTTKRNDDRLNSHNRVMLQHWRANVDLQLIVDPDECAKYLAKYAAKGEPRSQPVQQILKTCVNNLKQDDRASSSIKKAMMKVVGERDFSAQETAHLLASNPLYHCTFSFLTICLNGGRRLKRKDEQEDDSPEALDVSMMDNYANRGAWAKQFPNILGLNLLQFASQYVIKKGEATLRSKEVIVRTFPSYSSTTKNYPIYCKYQLIKYKPWSGSVLNAWGDVEETDEVLTASYDEFLQSSYAQIHVPKLMEDIQAANEYYQQFETEDDEPRNEEEEVCDEWMLLCRLNERFQMDDGMDNDAGEVDWSESSSHFPEELLRACPDWIMQQRKDYQQGPKSNATSDQPASSVESLNEQQRLAYDIVTNHNQTRLSGDQVKPLHMIICGTAGTGKSYLIASIKQSLGSSCILTGTTGMAAFNINGSTIHSALQLPVQNFRKKELDGKSLQRLQMELSGVHYIIIDEMSMLGLRMLAWIDKRLRQNTGKLDEAFGDMSLIFIGDFAQLPPVGDRPMYAMPTSSVLSEQGKAAYTLFDTVVCLTQVVRQAGHSPEAKRFRDLLLRLRDGESTREDWQQLVQRSPSHVNLAEFREAVRLFFDKKNVAEYNYQKLQSLNVPIARISARHKGPGAQAAKSDDAGGLDPEIFLAKGADVMLTSNLWQQVGLCNGAFGTVRDILYSPGSGPPHLPIAVLVEFPHYKGPPFLEEQPHVMPIPPHFYEWVSPDNKKLSRQQLPLRLRYAMTIHKSQGQTLSKVVIDLGRSERAAGCSFVAVSRVRSIRDVAFDPCMSFDRLLKIGACKGLQLRLNEDKRLVELSIKSGQKYDATDAVLQNNKEDKTATPRKRERANSSSAFSHTGKPKQKKQDTKCTGHKATELNRTSQLAVSVPTTILFNGNTSLDIIKRFVRCHVDDLHWLLQHLRGLDPPRYDPSKHHIAQNVDYHLHPSVSVGYAAVSTSPDGNCLWHMVSIALCGSESLTASLRVITLFSLVVNEAYFQDLILQDANPRRTFEDVVRVAATWGAWGDEYHLHALAIALTACICIFTTFRQADGYIPYLQYNGGMLSSLFRQGANHTRQHIRYQKPGSPDDIFSQLIMYGFFMDHHYTAMLPRSQMELSFIPCTNLFSHGKVHLLSQTFNM